MSLKQKAFLSAMLVNLAREAGNNYTTLMMAKGQASASPWETHLTGG